MRNVPVFFVGALLACDTSEPVYPIDPPRPRPDPAPLFAPTNCPDVEYRELETTAWVIAEASNGTRFIGALPVNASLNTALERSFLAPAGAIDLAALPDAMLAVLTANEVVLVDTTGTRLASFAVEEGTFSIGFDGEHLVLGRDSDVSLMSLDGELVRTIALRVQSLPELDGDTDLPFLPRLDTEQAPQLRQVVPLADATHLMLMETDGVPEPIVPPFDGVVVSSNAPSQSSELALLSSSSSSSTSTPFPDFVTTFLVHALGDDGTEIQLKDTNTAGSDGCHVVIIERFIIDGDRHQTISFHRPDRVRYVVEGTGSWVRESDGTVSYAQVPFEPRIVAATGVWLP